MKNSLLSKLYELADSIDFSTLPHSLTNKEAHCKERLLWYIQSAKFVDSNSKNNKFPEFINTVVALIHINKSEESKSQATHDGLRRIKNLIQRGYLLPYKNKVIRYSPNLRENISNRVDLTKPIKEIINQLLEISTVHEKVSVEGTLKLSRLETEEEAVSRLKAIDHTNKQNHDENRKILTTLLEKHGDIFTTKEDILKTGKLIPVYDTYLRLIPAKFYNYLYTLFPGEYVLSISGFGITISSSYQKEGEIDYIKLSDGEWLDVGFAVE